MFGFSWSEILIIAVVALLVVGPKDLPRAMKQAARWMRAGQKLAREFQGHVDDLVRQAELDDLRDQAQKLANMSLSDHIQSTIDPDRKLAEALAPPEDLLSPPIPAEPAPVNASPELAADKAAAESSQMPLPIAEEPAKPSEPAAAQHG